MVAALAYFAFFACVATAFFAVVLSRPPRNWRHGLVAALTTVVFFVVLGWALVHFVFSQLH